MSGMASSHRAECTRMRVVRRSVSGLAALGAAAALAGCSHAATPPPSAPSSVPPSPAQSSASQPAGYDISKVDDVKDDFPSGFTAQAHPAKTLDQQDINGSQIAAFIGAQVDPPQCRSVVIPPYAEPVVGTQAAGVRAEGDQGAMYVVALRSPKPNPISPPPAGCDQIALSGSPEASGTVEQVPAPDIAGVTTTGVKLTTDDPDDDPDYLYTAALDDQTAVVVMGSADTQLDPQKFLADLLVKAVSAVRGQ
ncbi:MAG TPA: DUF5642 family protein [Mycobacterium sp.]|nr:DUF5642 family protein [Mycobacterium sp.]